MFCCFQFLEKVKAKALAQQQAHWEQQNQQQHTSSPSPSTFLLPENLPTLNIGYSLTSRYSHHAISYAVLVCTSLHAHTQFVHLMQNLPRKKQWGGRGSSTTPSTHRQELASPMDGSPFEWLDRTSSEHHKSFKQSSKYVKNHNKIKFRSRNPIYNSYYVCTGARPFL